MAMHYGEYCILREETVRERRGSYNGFCCRLYPFILLDNNKEKELTISLVDVAHTSELRISVSLLYCVSSVFYFRICFILFICDLFFLTTSIRAKGNSQERKKAPGSSGSSGGTRKF